MKKILLLLFLSFTILYASVGKITATKGEVFISRDGKQITATKGSLLELQDSIITKENSKALVLLNDKTSITVGKNSNLGIEDFVLDVQKPSKSKATFKFGKGIFRTITGQIGKINKDKFKIKTKSASIGIRGTVFVVEVKTTDLKIGVINGGVFMTPLDQGINPVDIQKDQVLTYNDETKEFKVEPLSNWKEGGDMGEEEETNSQENEEQKQTPAQEKAKPNENNNFQDVDNGEFEKEVTLLAPKLQNTLLPEKITQIVEEVSENTKKILKENNENELEEQTVQASEEIEEIITPPAAGGSSGATINPAQSIPLIENIASITNKMMSEHSDTYMEFGYALNVPEVLSSAYGIYITGDITPTEVIDSYISQGTTASYSGAISSLVNGAAADGTINLNVNFGGKTFSGNLNIPQGGWQANINNGTLTPTGISATDITGSSSYGTIDSGSLNGKFYGPSATSVGGTINLQSGSNSASGVFGASQQ